jgi:hypothetical protein
MNLIDSASLVVTPNAYKTSKLYSIVPTNGTGDLTFSRTGDTATRVNSAGLIETVLADRPRLDYLGSNCPKLLLEPQRTNLLIRSEELDNGSWSKSGATVSANQIVSPDGTTDADKIVESNTNAQHFIIQSISLTASTTYTISAYLKAGERTRATIRVRTIGGDFDTLVDLVAGTTDFGTLTSVGNGWFRFARTITTGTGTATQSVQIFTRITGSQTYQGDGTSGVYVWGTQLEAGSFVSSYIPTTTATVTRSADQCYDDTATALIGQTEGTIFIDFDLNNVGDENTRNIITLGLFGALYTDRIMIAQSSIASGNKYRFIFRANNSNLVDDLTLSYTSGRAKLAVKYNSSSMQVFLNGVLVKSFTFTSTAFSTNLTTVYLGNFTNVNQPNGHRINSAILWKTRLSDQELITLTSL